MKKIFLLAIFMIAPINAKADITHNQRVIIAQCFEIGNLYLFGNTVFAIAGVESSWGVSRIGDNGESLGVMQIKFKTAKWFLAEKLDIIIKDKKLRKMLLNDDEFNINLGCLYLQYLMNKFNGNYLKAILAYNVGASSVHKHGLKYDPQRYLEKILYYKNLISIKGI